MTAGDQMAAMHTKILELLELFREQAPDAQIHARVTELVADQTKWPQAHDLFDEVRRRLLATTQDRGWAILPASARERAKVYQYGFEELCLKAIFNETPTDVPFDPDSPFWIAGSAIQLARRLGISSDLVIEIIAPPSK